MSMPSGGSSGFALPTADQVWRHGEDGSGFDLLHDRGVWKIKRDGIDQNFEVLNITVTQGATTEDYLQALMQRHSGDELRQKVLEAAASTVSLFAKVQSQVAGAQHTGTIVTEFAGQMHHASFQAKKITANLHGADQRVFAQASELAAVSHEVDTLFRKVFPDLPHMPQVEPASDEMTRAARPARTLLASIGAASQPSPSPVVRPSAAAAAAAAAAASHWDSPLAAGIDSPVATPFVGDRGAAGAAAASSVVGSIVGVPRSFAASSPAAPTALARSAESVAGAAAAASATGSSVHSSSSADFTPRSLQTPTESGSIAGAAAAAAAPRVMGASPRSVSSSASAPASEAVAPVREQGARAIEDAKIALRKAVAWIEHLAAKINSGDTPVLADQQLALQVLEQARQAHVAGVKAHDAAQRYRDTGIETGYKERVEINADLANRALLSLGRLLQDQSASFAPAQDAALQSSENPAVVKLCRAASLLREVIASPLAARASGDLAEATTFVITLRNSPSSTPRSS